MITGNIKDAKRYYSIIESFEEAFEFLKTLDENSAPGSHNFDTFRVNVVETETSEKENAVFEAHRDFLDIHFVLCGEEGIEYADVNNLTVTKEYDSAEDYMLLSGKGYRFSLKKGDFCIVFPEDAHAPCLLSGNSKHLKKAIVKIKL